MYSSYRLDNSWKAFNRSRIVDRRPRQISSKTVCSAVEVWCSSDYSTIERPYARPGNSTEADTVVGKAFDDADLIGSFGSTTRKDQAGSTFGQGR